MQSERMKRKLEKYNRKIEKYNRKIEKKIKASAPTQLSDNSCLGPGDCNAPLSPASPLSPAGRCQNCKCENGACERSGGWSGDHCETCEPCDLTPGGKSLSCCPNPPPLWQRYSCDAGQCKKDPHGPGNLEACQASC